MSEQSKSEQATPYKLEQARKKGMVAKSAELGALCVMAAALLFATVYGDALWQRLGRGAAHVYAVMGAAVPDTRGATGLQLGVRAFRMAVELLWPALLTMLLVLMCGLFAQTGFVFAPAALKPDVNRFNPMTGLRRIFSRQTLIDAGKAIAKLAVYAAATAIVVARAMHAMVAGDVEPNALGSLLAKASLQMLAVLLGIAAAFAAIDQIIARRMFSRQMRMSRHEVKQEFKQREGDPRIKQRRRQLQRELLKRAASARGVMAADVVVTNPTHILIGLKYDKATMLAPRVVARGAGEFAQRLRSIAFLHGVPIVQSPALARQLYAEVPQDGDVPEKLFRPVADIYLRIRAK